ncbi:MAG: ABC transporter ATP-binding protein [Clostridiales Family XIII bacterium]|jgi:NitT/TauT family transport system ATP-binding protein|nr:ABC transporter ATP-binding protein [Clostridiales Family XIII bacterium]
MGNVVTLNGETAQVRDEIVVKDLNLFYKTRRKKGKDAEPHEALRDVNLAVKEGEFLSVVGPSGCGKSTLLYILAGLNKKTSGEVIIGDKQVNGPSQDRGIIMQAYALFPWRSIIKNVEFGLEVKGTPRKQRREIAQSFIDLVGLSGYENKYPYELSGGMKQRIAIARALAYDPDVLLMDEPFAAVDEQTRSFLHEELLNIWEKTHKTIVFVTHSIDEAVFLSDRVAVMTPGPGTIKEIVDINLPRPRHADLKTTEEFGHFRTKVWQLLQSKTDRAVAIEAGNNREIVNEPQDMVI